jgi:hypothetical protein
VPEAVMLHRLSRYGCVLLSCVVLGCGDRAIDAQTSTNADARVLADYKTRIDKYMELHNQLEKDGPPLKETKNPAEIQASQGALATRILAARKGARQGEIFTAEIREVFRRLMYPETKGTDGKAVKESIKEDAPRGVPIRVNVRYPENAPLPTVPPSILAALPKLPEDLEYRIINKDLILRDVHANIIVDFIKNAIQ